jgi:hypothetical protein
MGTTLNNAFIRGQAQPIQRTYDIIFSPGHKACLVGILNAEYEMPMVFFSQEIVIQCRPDAADMESPGGAGSKPQSNHEYFLLLQPLPEKKGLECKNA